ncbi:Serine/threonine-protein kinase HSL1 [Ceratocystis lukuohia]|uniref:non-specific serine/threonine protein kinase n=1 Tax=Ceratocystis lukuohia TaxID=2019550 RepID=A0ABR4MBW5_9PEZI
MGEPRQPLSDAPTRANQGRRYSSLPAGIRGNGKKYRAPELVAIMGDGPVTAMQQDEVMRSERAATHSLRHKALHNAYAQQSDNGNVYRQPSIDLSARCERGYKINIGPWKLAHTLGRGASAEVKFCRHRVTGQPAACKIVSKHSSTLIQAGSLAALDRIDARMQQKLKNQMRVPVAVEREVAILKLVQHPNIMKLYDIWENGEYIYLILELVDDGDLFTLITRNGRLAEEAAISLFRQIMSAMTYCHYFKICHRDLKPENILVTHDGQVKIADFGMAALHQTETHKLHTACGSPHYAAPELLKAHHYLGNRADIWSMGVILFAMLTARLPFDEEEVSHVHAKVKRGEYEMPEFLSIEAKDLIRRMLEVNPDRRITMYDMWRHPLIMKYQAFDNLNPVTGQPPDVSLKFEPQPLRREEIDGQIVHQLRTLWHMFSEEDIVNNLVQKSPNTQQAFYWLLQNYRERQLEDFKPEIAHSRSDYHHFTPSAWKRKISTCEFTSGRSVSRFTVISQVAETEVETVASYDPYNVNKYSAADSSLASGNEPSRTKVTIHRRPSAHGQRDQSFSSTTQRIRRTGGTMASIRTARGTRIGPKTPSMGSMHSGKGVMYARPVPVHKRPAVNFTHIRRKSSAASRNGSIHVSSTGRGHSQRYMHGARGAHGSRDVRRRPSVKVPRPGTMQVSQTQDSALIDEEVRKFSSRIARDLDTAFNTSVVAEPSITGSLGLSSPTDTNEPKTPESFQSTDQTLVQDSTTEQGTWKDRPLPPLPERLKLLAASTPSKDDRRMVTAPAQLIRSNTNIEIFDTDADYLGKSSADKIRASSGPTRTTQRRGKGGEEKALRILENTENSIRVVNSPKRPLTGAGFMDRVMKDRKRESGTSMISDYGRRASTVMPKLGYHDESVSKRKPSWFQRLSSYSHTNEMVEAGDRLYAHQRPDHGSDSSSINGLQNKKKKRFGLLFWKTSKDGKQDADTTTASISSITRAPTPKPQDPVHENWIARMFRIKPAMEYLCFDMSRKEARNDLADLFREWKSFGMRDVAVDKDRNIVFARVSGKNSLGIKEVALAAEIMTVIEHGSNRPLSIVRFTQERGAASSFHTVVKTTKEVFSRRNKLVTDRQKSRMMIKTLNA